jgi:hypothetical protein
VDLGAVIVSAMLEEAHEYRRTRPIQPQVLVNLALERTLPILQDIATTGGIKAGGVITVFAALHWLTKGPELITSFPIPKS